MLAYVSYLGIVLQGNRFKHFSGITNDYKVITVVQHPHDKSRGTRQQSKAVYVIRSAFEGPAAVEPH